MKKSKKHPLALFRALVVDNDKRLTMLISDILESFGFEQIAFATDGQDALEKMEKKAFDFIICDWLMEPMDGIEFVHHVRNSDNLRHKYVPIIMLSGKAEHKDIELARDAGVTEFLAKPFDIEKFRTHIISIVENPREFVLSREFKGPSRRRKKSPLPAGIDKDRRKKV